MPNAHAQCSYVNGYGMENVIELNHGKNNSKTIKENANCDWPKDLNHA